MPAETNTIVIGLQYAAFETGSNQMPGQLAGLFGTVARRRRDSEIGGWTD
jgi:hypothetical protein